MTDPTTLDDERGSDGSDRDGVEHGAPVTPRWLAWSALGAAIGGFGVSVYLTVAHYASPAVLACSSSGTVNCERVTTSPQSEMLGIPVAILGMGWFAVMIALTVPRAWEAGPLVARARLVATLAGIGFALYLVYAELFEIHAICLWCTAAHLLAFALFVLVLIDVSRRSAASLEEP